MGVSKAEVCAVVKDGRAATKGDRALVVGVKVEAVSMTLDDLQVPEQRQLIEHIGDLAAAPTDPFGEGLVVQLWAVDEAALI